MAINGIGSYGLGYYNYQSSINDIRLARALANNKKFTQSELVDMAPLSGSMKSSMKFVGQYNSTMSELMKAAGELKSTNSSGAMQDLTVESSDTGVAEATEKWAVRSQKELTLEVTQLAQAQSNVSAGVQGADMAKDDMDFTVGNGVNSVNVKVTADNGDGTRKTNVQMLREAAQQINDSSAGIRATVTQKDGVATLALEGKSTGAAYRFSVGGELGAAAGLDQVENEAADAKYSVTSEGRTINYTSSTNEIRVDAGRIGVTLKGTGETAIRSQVDGERVASAVGDLVDAYNDALKLLNDNYDRGTGVDRQLRNLVRGLGSEQSLEKLGITVNKDATLNFDEEVLEKNLKEDPDQIRELITGTSGLANTAFNKARTGMEANSGGLIDNDLTIAGSELQNPYSFFGAFSRNGVYNMNNLHAVGMMMNYLV